MAKTNLVFYTDALAANPSQGIELMERSAWVSNKVLTAVKKAFEGAEDNVLQAALRLTEDEDPEIQTVGRLLAWSWGNFR